MTFLRILLLLGALPLQLFAIPAWSRATGASCSACHATPTWQLTPAGLDFLRKGHRNDLWKADLSAQSWDNHLSLYWKGRFHSEQKRRPSTQLELHSFSLYAGGPLGERFSYFAEYYLSENTGKTEMGKLTDGDGARKKLAEAYLSYNHPLPGEGYLTVRGGQILPEILHTFGVGARSAEQRAIVLNEGVTPFNPYKPFSRQTGVDLNAHWGTLEISGGLVNGSAGTNTLDADNHKDLFGSLQWNLDDEASALGLFHYAGRYSVYAAPGQPGSALRFVDPFRKSGLLFRFARRDWRITAALFEGRHQVDPAGAAARNLGGYALLDWNFTPAFGLFARMENLDPDRDRAGDSATQVLVGGNGLLFVTKKGAARWNLELSRRRQNGTTADRVYFQVGWTL